MVSIVRRTGILVFARLANRALSFLGPLFMVRLLTVDQYGQYRDFLLYGTMLLPWMLISINSSLAYFIPKDPDNERLYLSQATLFILCSSIVVIGMVLLFGDHLPSATVRALIYPLCLFMFFVANFDAWEIYWLAKRETINVLYYSIARFGVRTAVVVGAAYFTRRVEPVIWALVVFEGARLLSMAAYGAYNRLLTKRIDVKSIKSQLGFSLPIGASGIVGNLNSYLGHFFVSMQLGPAALAVYAIGVYLQPIIQVFRNSVSDVIMPEIVSQQQVEPRIALGLWKRATVIYCAVMLPLAALLFYYADIVVETLFTSAYASATPIFQIYTLILVRECFDFGLPLRVVNRTRLFLNAGVIGLVVNLLMLVALFDWLGVLAPAIAIIFARFVGGIYLGSKVIKYCGFSLANMLSWWDISKTFLICLLCIPVLYAGELFEMRSLLRAMMFGTIYIFLYIGLLRTTGIPEIKDAIDRIWFQVIRGTASNNTENRN